MNRTALSKRVRALTRDFSNSVFREEDIINFINEGIERIRQLIPELSGMTSLDTTSAEPILLPSQYHHLLAIYATARCFSQDERHYQATTFMNEFEVKLDELKGKIESGEIIITNPDTGEAVKVEYKEDYVVDNYFLSSTNMVDVDDGVDGVE